MFNQNIISNKFDLNLSTTLSSYIFKNGLAYSSVTIVTIDKKQYNTNALEK
jgi:hypothetical protein